MSIRETSADDDPVEPVEPVDPQDGELTYPEGRQVMGMLHDHVPMSLLMDLSAPSGPNSETIITEEESPDDAWWEQR